MIITKPVAVFDAAARRRWLLAAVVAAAFALLTAQVLSSGWLARGDEPTLDWLVAHRSDAWTSIATFITNFGGPAGTIVIGVAVAAYLAWRTRRLAPGAVVLGAVAIATVANAAMKLFVGRERPPALTRLIDETNQSYPSGHVAGTTALVGVVLLVYLAGRPGRPRAWIATVAGALIVAAIALTRLYLGVHWLSDTVGGALLGATVVLTVAAVVASFPALDIRTRPQSSAPAPPLPTEPETPPIRG